MHDAGVLQVGALFQDDTAEITAQGSQWPYVATRAHDHVTDQHGTGVDIGSRVDHWGQAIEAVARHVVYPEMIRNVCRSCIVNWFFVKPCSFGLISRFQGIH
ncbi:hypothetical protein D3C76_1259910 [compost metagenome]